jgi:intein-encoded DNA endonuclease-like protein
MMNKIIYSDSGGSCDDIANRHSWWTQDLRQSYHSTLSDIHMHYLLKFLVGLSSSRKYMLIGQYIHYK